MNAIADAATNAAITLNNAALRAPEPEWRRVQAVVRDLEDLAVEHTPIRAALRRLGIQK